MVFSFLWFILTRGAAHPKRWSKYDLLKLCNLCVWPMRLPAAYATWWLSGQQAVVTAMASSLVFVKVLMPNVCHGRTRLRMRICVAFGYIFV